MKLFLAFSPAGVHPDDVELGCSGYDDQMKYTGEKSGIVDLTQGELGTRVRLELRYQEAGQCRDDHRRQRKEGPQEMRDGFQAMNPARFR